MNKILLDTNAYSNLLRGDHLVLEALGEADQIYLSIFVIAELYYGFKGGSNEEQNISYLKAFKAKSKVQILDATEVTADIFSNIKQDLKRAGKPIPINDVWIASHAMETGSALISYDAHFLAVPGLRIWDKLRLS